MTRAVSQPAAVIWVDMFEKWVTVRGSGETPRRRYSLPKPVVFALLPLFRYSDWRDAWILRVVGERYGPVVRMPPGQHIALHVQVVPESWKVLPRWPTTLRVPTPALVAGALAIAAVFGFFIARSAFGASPAPSLGSPTSAGAIEASLPDGWRPQPALALSRLGLLAGTGVASGGRSIVVGTAATTDASLLPAAILRAVRGAPSAELITLRGTTFYRYADLALRGTTGSVTVYATPTTSGTVLAVCRTPSPDAGFASTCQQVVRSLRLRSGSLAPGLVPAYAATLRAVIDSLNVARAEWGSQLSAAPTAGDQASAAARLSAGYDEASAGLSGQNPGAARSDNDALVAALRMDADAYSALARAAAGRRVGEYRTDTAAIARTNDGLTAALAALGSFGYRTR